jgi:hypothetical protein
LYTNLEKNAGSPNFRFTAFYEVLVQASRIAEPRTWTEDAPLGAAQGRVKYREYSDRGTMRRRRREQEGALGEEKRTTSEEARRVGDEIGVDWERFELEQFRIGMDVEYEHGAHDPQTDVTGDDPILTGKIALAHMKEFPDYYERLERMEKEAERERTESRRSGKGS